MSSLTTATPPAAPVGDPLAPPARTPEPRVWRLGGAHAATSDPIAGGASRRPLAQNRWVWTATGGIFAAFATACGLAPVAFSGLHDTALWLLAAALAVIAALIVTRKPAAIGTAANNVLLLTVYASVVAAMWAFQPFGSVGAVAAMFIGPLTALRLVDRRQVALHLFIASVAIVLLPVLGLVDRGTVMACTVLIPSIWVFASAAVVLLEAVEYQSDQLELLVRHDPLTGVGNRRMLTERLEQELAEHRRTKQPLSLVALDLNGFKALNDTVGHAAGDQLLRDIAAVLVHAVGADDTVVRQGGDEFCLIMVGTAPGEAMRTIRTIRAALHAFDESAGAPITVGAGVAAFPRDAGDAAGLLHCADERLRADKSGHPGPRIAPEHAIQAVDAALTELATD